MFRKRGKKSESSKGFVITFALIVPRFKGNACFRFLTPVPAKTFLTVAFAFVTLLTSSSSFRWNTEKQKGKHHDQSNDTKLKQNYWISCARNLYENDKKFCVRTRRNILHDEDPPFVDALLRILELEESSVNYEEKVISI